MCNCNNNLFIDIHKSDDPRAMFGRFIVEIQTVYRTLRSLSFSVVFELPRGFWHQQNDSFFIMIQSLCTTTLCYPILSCWYETFQSWFTTRPLHWFRNLVLFLRTIFDQCTLVKQYQRPIFWRPGHLIFRKTLKLPWSFRFMMGFSTCGIQYTFVQSILNYSCWSTPQVQEQELEAVWAQIYLLKSHHCPDD